MNGANKSSVIKGQKYFMSNIMNLCNLFCSMFFKTSHFSIAVVLNFFRKLLLILWSMICFTVYIRSLWSVFFLYVFLFCLLCSRYFHCLFCMLTWLLTWLLRIYIHIHISICLSIYIVTFVLDYISCIRFFRDTFAKQRNFWTSTPAHLFAIF